MGGSGTRAERRLADADWLTRRATVAVLEALTAEGHKVRIVGGAVRNALMGEPVNDIDMATDARPETVMALAARAGLKAVPTGLPHGTVTVVSAHAPYEVTTLRKDVETFGRHARVDFTDDWAADAKRRDFTINALFCEADGSVVDLVGGLDDLAARRVRFIGSAVDRIREDYLRILRFFRFTATYGNGAIDGDGLAACLAERAGLKQLSGERIHTELKRLLTARKALPTLDVMLGHGLLVDIVGVPWLGRLRRVAEQEQALGAAPDPTLRLGGLAVSVEEDALRLFERLRLSCRERDRLLAMATTLPAPFPTDPEGAEQLLYRLGPVAYRDRLMLAWTRSGAAADDAGWMATVALLEGWQARQFPLRGRDLLAFGAAPGPGLGQLLAEIEETWIAGGFTEDREGLLALARRRLAATQ
jgi:tRNA nucleotidyltransferase/poly(A) polymerase